MTHSNRNHRASKAWRTAIAVAVLMACGGAQPQQSLAQDGAAPAGPRATIPVCSVSITDRLPHDPTAFTEGLFYRNGKLYESTGLEGHSVIRIVEPRSGAVLRETALSPELFGEGIVDWGDEIISLTWQGGIGFRWNRRNLRQTGSFRYPGEGWALTRNASAIFMSDGTAQLRVLDPQTMTEQRRINVTADGQPVANLNELEWMDGAILANIWFSDRVARIDPASGQVTAWIDMATLRRDVGVPRRDVLNGLAYDARGRRLMATGKNWPTVYVISIGACVPAR